MFYSGSGKGIIRLENELRSEKIVWDRRSSRDDTYASGESDSSTSQL